jgi:hypothetical protein
MARHSDDRRAGDVFYLQWNARDNC